LRWLWSGRFFGAAAATGVPSANVESVTATVILFLFVAWPGIFIVAWNLLVNVSLFGLLVQFIYRYLTI
jgi:hypothetical protein